MLPFCLFVITISSIYAFSSFQLHKHMRSTPYNVQNMDFSRKNGRVQAQEASISMRMKSSSFHETRSSVNHVSKSIAMLAIVFSLTSLSMATLPSNAASIDEGANVTSNTKIKKGGASTLQQGISKVSLSL
jgi:preprotein translocase subunit SecG